MRRGEYWSVANHRDAAVCLQSTMTKSTIGRNSVRWLKIKCEKFSIKLRGDTQG